MIQVCEEGFITSESSTVKHQWHVGMGHALKPWHSRFGVAKVEKVWDSCGEIWSCHVYCVEKLVGLSGGTWF